MKKFFVFLLGLMVTLMTHASIVVKFDTANFPMIKKDVANFGLRDTTIEYVADGETKTLQIGYDTVATAAKTSTGSRYKYIMLAGSEGNSYIYSDTAIDGYYVAMVQLNIPSNSAKAAEYYVSFGKDKIDHVNIEGEGRKKDESTVFKNTDKDNKYWNISLPKKGTNPPNGQLDSVLITYLKTDGSEDSLVPPDEPTVYDTISVSAALDSIKNNVIIKNNVLVRGFVSSVVSKYQGYAVFYMADENHPENRIQAWNTCKPDRKKFASLQEIEDSIAFGDIVLIHADSLKYYEDKDGDTTKNKNEINGGRFVRRVGTMEPDIVALTGGEVEFDLTEGKAILKLAIFDTIININLNVEKDLENKTGSIARDYEKLNETMRVVAPSDTSEVHVLALEVLIKYVSVNDAGNNAYTVKVAAYDTMAGSPDLTYLRGDTILITGKDEHGDAVYFTIDNGVAVRKLSVARAIELTEALPADAETEEIFYVYGYWSRNKTAFENETQSFYMTDTEGDSNGEFYVYSASTDSAIESGDFVRVKGKLKNYKGNTPEISNGEAVIIDVADCPDLEPADGYDTISVQHAYEIGMDLQNETPNTTVTTDKTYVIVGYCTGIKEDYDTTYKNQSWWMANTTTDSVDFVINRAKPDSVVKVGDKMLVISKIAKYCGTSTKEGTEGQLYYIIQTVTKAQAYHTDIDVPDDPTALFGINSEDSQTDVVKIIENGRVIIIRNGVRYNLLGVMEQ